MAITRYGKQFPEGITDLDVELWCYAHDDRAEGERGRLTRLEHFENAVDLLWNSPDSTRRVIRNGWTTRMFRGMIYNRYCCLAGAGSSGKSDAAAVFCLVEWLARPTETLCLIMSTTLQGAKKRVWKSVNELWNSLEHQWKIAGVSAPGKMIDSRNMLVGLDITGKWSEGIGLCLIAADKDNEKEAAKKLKGLKAPAEGRGHLIAVADEATDLGDSVRVAMVGNLNTNPNFTGVFMGNPGSKLNMFGRVSEPLAEDGGWNSLSLGMQEWRTALGVVMSFDAHSSPRLIEPDGDEKYPWMPSRQAINQMAQQFGVDSLEYWAQVRGMFCPTGLERTVWSELELINAMPRVELQEWDFPPEMRCAALDPAFVTEGDRSPVCWAEFGTVKGRKTMNFLGFQIVQETTGTSVNDHGEEVPLTVSENVINQFRDLCSFHQVPPKRAGFDGTGAGITFGQWLHTKWSHAVHAVNFGTKPVERRADSQNEETIYKNRVTQLWVQPKALVREKQIRGVPMEIIEELCQRKWHEKRHTGTCACVEEKKDMKKRTGKSPDLADTFVILVEVAILNNLLDVIEIRKDDRRLHKQWGEVIHNQMGQQTTARKSLIAMPLTKRLKFTRNR
jgi:hypothetical protein